MNKRNAIVITGTPGTGKSSVAKLVANRLGLRVVSLNQIAVEVGAISSKDKTRETMEIKTVPLRKALKQVLTENPGDVVVEGHFGELTPKGCVRMAIVLRTNPLVLRERLRERGYSAEKVRENVEAELLDACLIAAVEAFGVERVREVDTSEATAEQTAADVLRALDGSGGLPAGSVSWIARLEGEGRLKDLITQ